MSLLVNTLFLLTLLDSIGIRLNFRALMVLQIVLQVLIDFYLRIELVDSKDLDSSRILFIFPTFRKRLSLPSLNYLRSESSILVRISF